MLAADDTRVTAVGNPKPAGCTKISSPLVKLLDAEGPAEIRFGVLAEATSIDAEISVDDVTPWVGVRFTYIVR